MENIKFEKCPVYKKCGACQLQNMDYQEQLHYKTVKVIGLLGEYGHVHPITGMYYPLHYRNKVSAAFADIGGRAVCGIWQSASGRIIDSRHCLLEDKKCAEIVSSIRDIVSDLEIPAYDRTNGTGFLRSVLVRRGFSTGKILVALTSVSPIFPKRNIFIDKLLNEHPEITTIVHNFNHSDVEFVYSGRETVLYGDGYIEDKLLGRTFRITASSFYQINPKQTEKLYSKAMELAGLSGKETVIDAYCGIGTIGMVAAKNAKSVIGIELNGASVKNAKSAAHENGIRNIRFYKADASDFMSQAALEGKRCDVIFMDPPRSGSTPEFISAAAGMAPKKIIYISCNPQTQARDLELFMGEGYIPQGIYPYDMFPFTNHVETIVPLIKK